MCAVQQDIAVRHRNHLTVCLKNCVGSGGSADRPLIAGFVCPHVKDEAKFICVALFNDKTISSASHKTRRALRTK